MQGLINRLHEIVDEANSLKRQLTGHHVNFYEVDGVLKVGISELKEVPEEVDTSEPVKADEE